MRQNRTINYGYDNQTSCKQCGTCCTKGGAALHSEDLILVQNGKVLRSDCITLRKGEFAHNPVTGKIEAIPGEIIKLRGTGGEWACCYLNSSDMSCGIYKNRPLACRTLKCWDPEESLKLAGRDLLSREMILQNEKQLIKKVMEYEQEFLLPDFTMLSQNLKTDKEKMVRMLETMVNRDLAFRDKQVQQSSPVAKEELFLFGRPLFQLLQPFGLTVFQKGERLCLKIQ
jgi:Fe-S-cluster containining protein